MSEKSSRESQAYLEKLGVTVITGTVVKSYDGKTVAMQNGETIDATMVIWSAGIKGNVPDGIQTDLIVKGNRIKVDRMNKVQNMSNVYAIGDVAYMETDKYPNGHPQVASVAIQQGALLASNLKKIKEKITQLDEFEYNDKGTMATVGRNLAVVDIPKPRLHFKGFFAWMIWMTLHLVLLLGVKNRLAVFSNWIYNYITYDQNLRLIFKEFYRPKKEPG
jgi:NADH dehydrogenase